MNNLIPIELTNANVREISFQVLVDILGDNSYSLDISNQVETIDNIVLDVELKSAGSVLGKPSVNTATITLLNADAKFSPNNPNNIEYDYAPTGKFRIGTKIKIIVGFIDSTNQAQTRELFNGYITAFKGKYSGKDKKMTLTLKDQAKLAQGKKNPDHTYVNGKYYESILIDKTLSEAIDYLIDYCYGESFPRVIQTLTTKFPIIEFPIDQNVWTTIQKFCEACEARAYFDNGTFYFITPLSTDYNVPNESQYTFTGSNIFDYTEDVDETNIKNKWKITSNAKTVQPRQVLVGTPSVNVITAIEDYKNTDTKNALSIDNKTITLKCQESEIWIDTINVPMVDTITYSDLTNPTQEDIDNMNSSSIVKVWDKKNQIQLTIQDIDVKLGKIELVNAINPSDYDIQITYQYYNDRIIHGKYKWYEMQLEKIGLNVEKPIIEANNGLDSIVYSWVNSTNTLYLSDWELLEGNTRVKYKLTNNVPINGDLNIVYISKMETFGNALECTTPLTFTAVDADTIDDFENSYEIQNDYFINPDWGKQVVDYYLYKYKNNITIIEANTKGIPQLDLFDRVTLNDTSSGTNFDFIVIGIKHSIKKDGFKTQLTLESLIAPWIYDPSRVNSWHYEAGQNYLSLYLWTNPPAPTNLQLEENTYVQKSGEVITQVNVTFNKAIYPYYGYSFIQSSTDNTNWYDIGPTIDGTYAINGLKIGTTYYIRVKTVSLNGLSSDYISSSIAITGKDNPPGDITGFNITQNGITLKASITPPSDPDIRNYEIRLGPTWENSSLIKVFNDVQTTFDAPQEGVQTFWCKAVDNSGNKSANAKKAVITIYGLPTKNIIFETETNVNEWTTTGMYNCPFDPSCIKINSVETIDDGEFFCDMFEGGHTLRDDAEILLPVVDLGPNVIAEGYFYIDPWGTVKLNTVESFGNGVTFGSIFNTVTTYVVPQFKVETFMNLDIDYQKNSNNYVNIQYRTSLNGTSWGEWTDLINHQFFGRYLQLKLRPGSLDHITNVVVCGANIKIDVPDLEENIENIDIPALKTTINFRQKFYDVPNSIALWTMDDTGKMCTWRITGITNAKFDLELLDNSGNLIAGKLIRANVRGY